MSAASLRLVNNSSFQEWEKSRGAEEEEDAGTRGRADAGSCGKEVRA